jgi:hypothetical protein
MIGLLVTSGDNACEQTLIVPADNKAVIYHRVTTGERGAGQAWHKSEQYLLPTTKTVTSPIAVVLTLRDYEMIAQGQVNGVATKALMSEALPNLPFEGTHNGLVSNLVRRLTDGDNTLNDYVADKRRTSPIVLSPLAEMALPDFSTGATSEPIVTSPVVESVVTKSEPSLSMALATIPDPKWANTYVNRTISGVKDFDILDVAMKNNQNVLIKGHAGSGKTMCALAYAGSRGYRYYNVSSHNGLEPSELFGQWIPTADGHYKWQDGAVTDMVRNGGVLLLNEVNFIPERVTTVLFGLLDDRREIQLLANGGEVIKAHKDLLIIADMNPDYRGTRPMNQAWHDRFMKGHILEFPYDQKIEAKLIKSKALLEVANALRARYDLEEINTPISTRALVGLVTNAQNLGLQYAINSYLNGFDEKSGERGAVKLVIDTYLSRIANDLGITGFEATSNNADEPTQTSAVL